MVHLIVTGLLDASALLLNYSFISMNSARLQILRVLIMYTKLCNPIQILTFVHAHYVHYRCTGIKVLASMSPK